LQRILKECEYLDQHENLLWYEFVSKSVHHEDKSIRKISDSSMGGRAKEIFIIKFLFTSFTYQHCHLISTPTFVKKIITNVKSN